MTRSEELWNEIEKCIIDESLLNLGRCSINDYS